MPPSAVVTIVLTSSVRGFTPQALPRVVQLLGEELHWSRARRKAELLDGNKYLDTFEL
jgi:hypothetical protein